MCDPSGVGRFFGMETGGVARGLAQPPATAMLSLRDKRQFFVAARVMAGSTKAMELRGQVRSQMEFGNEGRRRLRA